MLVSVFGIVFAFLCVWRWRPNEGHVDRVYMFSMLKPGVNCQLSSVCLPVCSKVPFIPSAWVCVFLFSAALHLNSFKDKTISFTFIFYTVLHRLKEIITTSSMLTHHPITVLWDQSIIVTLPCGCGNKSAKLNNKTHFSLPWQWVPLWTSTNESSSVKLFCGFGTASAWLRKFCGHG